MTTDRDWLDLDSPPDIPWPPADYAATRLPNDIPDPEKAELPVAFLVPTSIPPALR